MTFRKGLDAAIATTLATDPPECSCGAPATAQHEMGVHYRAGVPRRMSAWKCEACARCLDEEREAVRRG